MTRYLFIAALGSALAFAGGAAADDCLSNSCHADIRSLKHAHQPAGSGSCLSCHLQKGKEHPAKGVKTFALAAQKEALCATCHDAFRGRYQHGPVSEGACLACHDPHGSTQKGLLKAASRELCLNCHEDFASGLKGAVMVHPPVREKPCTSCHDPHSSEFRFLLKKKMPELCVECHKEIGKKIAGAKTVHKPMLDGRGCGNCHSTHYSKAPGLLISEQKTLCLNCHGANNAGGSAAGNMASELTGKKQLHGPVKEGKCGGCHDPHASDFPKILRASYPGTLYAPYRVGAYNLCLKCHDKNLLAFPETTIYTKFRNGDRNLHYVHVADGQKGRTCGACHGIHGADGEKLIRKEGVRFGQWQINIRFKSTVTGGSCAPGCHWSLAYDRNNPVSYDKANKPAVK